MKTALVFTQIMEQLGQIALGKTTENSPAVVAANAYGWFRYLQSRKVIDDFGDPTTSERPGPPESIKVEYVDDPAHTPTGLKLIRTRTEEIYMHPDSIQSIYRIEHADSEATSLVYFRDRHARTAFDIAPEDLIAQLEAGK